MKNAATPNTTTISGKTFRRGRAEDGDGAGAGGVAFDEVGAFGFSVGSSVISFSQIVQGRFHEARQGKNPRCAPRSARSARGSIRVRARRAKRYGANARSGPLAR